MKKANNTLKRAKRIKLQSDSFLERNRLKSFEGSDLFKLKVKDSLNLDLDLFGLKSDLDLEIYSPRKKLGKVLKKIGKTNFGELSKKEIRKYLDRISFSENKRNNRETINDLLLEPGTYFIRVYGKKRKNRSKYKLELQKNNAPEPQPPSITSHDGNDTVVIIIPENTTTVTDVNATDPNGETENGGGLTYSITGGADRELFTIDPLTGALSFKTAPDFESPQDRGANNGYVVEATVMNTAGLKDTQMITVNVEDENDVDEPEEPEPEPQPPNITSNSGEDTVDISIPENTTTVTDVNSEDPNGETENGGGLTYSITGGADREFFTIDPLTGALSFKTAPDFESPQDRGANNGYVVEATVMNTAGLKDTQMITVNVDDEDEQSNSDSDDSDDDNPSSGLDISVEDGRIVVNNVLTGQEGGCTTYPILCSKDLIVLGNISDDELNDDGLSAIIEGFDGNDSIRSTIIGYGPGSDLYGGRGNDELIGNAGNDVLGGGLGFDVMTGGGGADRFRLISLAEGQNDGQNVDRITDFSASEGDKIELNFTVVNALSRIEFNVATGSLTLDNEPFLQLEPGTDFDVSRDISIVSGNASPTLQLDADLLNISLDSGMTFENNLITLS